LAGLLFFVGSLFPALGFVNVYPFVFSFVADHFQYLACLGLIVPTAAALALLFSRTARGIVPAVGVVLLAGLATLTWRQTETHHDVFTLYETTIEKNPRCWMAHNNLAEAMAQSGQVSKQFRIWKKHWRCAPTFPKRKII
jgi:predicted O-linked N-acetylglucosamine transferase (SPINDLY family)